MRHLFWIVPALLSSSPLLAQSGTSPEPLPGAVRNAGSLNLATGTWTRSSGGSANLGPDVIYRNDAASGYFTTLGSAAATGDYSIIDSGRLPSLGSSIAGADRDEYLLNGMTFSYCSDISGPNVAITFNVYDAYMPCDLVVTAPAAPFNLAGTVVATGLPGGTSAGAACWLVTLDLEGVADFCAEADGGPVFPGEDLDINTDSFGLEWIFNGAAGSSTGPLIAGDPAWTWSEPGALFWGGGGTYYASGPSTCGETGLDSQDFFAVDGLGASLAPGCYFFGGYQNTNGCGTPNTPFASFNMTLFGADAGSGCDPTPPPFCDPAAPNSSGTPVELSVSAATVGAGVHLDAAGGPPGFFGYFLVSAGNTASIALGDGTLCLNGPQGRYNPAAGGSRNSVGQFDAAGVLQNLAGTSTTGIGFDVPTQLPSPPGGSIMAGDTWHFQLWYRDANPTSTVNFSNGVSRTF